MDQEIVKKLLKDETGLSVYEYLANNIATMTSEDVDQVVELMVRVDKSGQFLCSTARYLKAIDGEAYAEQIDLLVSQVIERDREHKYLPNLIAGIWGADYEEHVEEYSAASDNFRRIYKRLNPMGGL